MIAHPRLFIAIAAPLWLALYWILAPASELLVAALPVDRASHLGGALQFFLYDTPKVLLLLSGIVFVMGMVNSAFTPERTRVLLAGRSEGVANVMAASLGVVTPFCSCSAVPLFIGFVQAGVPLGVTFSFLIAAPMVNEVALTLLFGLFGWRIALLYLGLGLSIAIVAGWVIGRLKMEASLEDWVRNMPRVVAQADTLRLTLSDRVEAGFASVREIVGKVWPYILAGIAIGAVIHGYVPEALMASIMGKDAWWSVPLAVVIGSRRTGQRHDECESAGHGLLELQEHHQADRRGRARERRRDRGGQGGGDPGHHALRHHVDTGRRDRGAGRACRRRAEPGKGRGVAGRHGAAMSRAALVVDHERE